MEKYFSGKFIVGALTILLSIAFLQIYAQVPSLSHPAPEVIPGQFDANDSLNELENDLVETDSLETNKISFADVDVPTYEDSIYALRIQAITSEVPLQYNDDVRRFIDLYVLDRRDQVQRMLGLSKIYFPIFDQVFTQYGVPTDLKYLSIIESALNPHAVSRCGATGMWQFMYSTAKLYGLSINSYVDERRDIIRSTEGAAQYLRSMYDIYGDWLLAIASYNCGPGNVNRAISLSGGNTFWEIVNYLPKETRSYVPAFIAATYVMNYYDLHDLYPEYPAYCFDSIAIVFPSGKMTMDEVAKYLDLPVEEIKFLNPGLRSNVIPALETQPYAFKIPCESTERFTAMSDSIILASQNVKTKYYYGSTYGGKVTYTVRSGDNLGKIAMKYHTTVSQLKKWNNLHSTTIRVGQRLKIYGKDYSPAPTQSTTTATKNTLQSSPLKTDVTSTATTTSNSTEFVYYKVRYGDTLWGIAKKYGTSITALRSLNGSKAENLKPGVVLKVSLKA